MAWTFVRPADPGVLSGRPLLDLGTGDGQTLIALTASAGNGLVVGLDRSLQALRPARLTGLELVVCSSVPELPFRTGSFEVVLAGDLFHHLGTDALCSALGELRRVLRSGGRVVAWWYERAAHPAPDAPKFPRLYADVAPMVEAAGFASVVPLELEQPLASGPPTVGLLASTSA
jgi:ubiquinone/menaquinone biosynthesis C-methylase UbiE